MDEQDWFAQFDTANADPNTGIFGGGGMSTLPGAPVATLSGPVPSASGGDVSMGAFNQAWLNSPYPGTVDGLKQFVAANPQYGVTLGGSKGDKVYGPGGAYWGDAVIGAGAGGLGKSALSGDTGGGGGAMGSLLAPYTDQYKLPTLDELKAMPGYQAALDASNRSTQSSAAAKGTLLTGGTQKALQQNAGDVANQFYGNLAQLKLGEMGFNRDTFYHNQDSPFSKLYSASQLGYQASSQPTAGPSTSTTSSYSPMSTLTQPAAAPQTVNATAAPTGAAKWQALKYGIK